MSVLDTVISTTTVFETAEVVVTLDVLVEGGAVLVMYTVLEPRKHEQADEIALEA